MKAQRWILLGTVLAFVMMTTAGVAGAKTLKELVQELSKENGEAYLRPVADGLGADLNSSIYTTAKPHGIAGFDIGIKFMAAEMPDAAKSFAVVVPPGGTYTVSPPTSATAVGSKDGGSTISGPGGPYNLPGGLDLKLVPLAVPQASVGIPFHTDIIVRYLPSIEVSSDIGKVSFFGIGAKHSLSQYLPMVPVDLAAYAMYQHLKVGNDLLTATNFAYGVCASKSFLLLTLYGGFGLEHASMDVKYTTTATTPEVPVGTDISLNFDSKASSRATIGARVTVLPLIFVHAEASKVFGSDNLGTVFGGGLGLKLR